MSTSLSTPTVVTSEQSISPAVTTKFSIGSLVHRTDVWIGLSSLIAVIIVAVSLILVLAIKRYRSHSALLNSELPNLRATYDSIMARKSAQQLRQQESQQAQSTFESGNAQPTWSDIELEDHICSASFSSIDEEDERDVEAGQ